MALYPFWHNKARWLLDKQPGKWLVDDCYLWKRTLQVISNPPLWRIARCSSAAVRTLAKRCSALLDQTTTEITFPSWGMKLSLKKYLHSYRRIHDRLYKVYIAKCLSLCELSGGYKRLARRRRRCSNPDDDYVCRRSVMCVCTERGTHALRSIYTKHT